MGKFQQNNTVQSQAKIMENCRKRPDKKTVRYFGPFLVYLVSTTFGQMSVILGRKYVTCYMSAILTSDCNCLLARGLTGLGLLDRVIILKLEKENSLETIIAERLNQGASTLFDQTVLFMPTTTLFHMSTNRILK